MTNPIERRAATQAEIAALQELLAGMTANRRWTKVAEHAIVHWASTMLFVCFIWFVAAWIGRRAFGVDFGMGSPSAIWIAASSSLACAVFTVISTRRWQKKRKCIPPLIQAAIDSRLVETERYTFTAAKRFQETDHGGLIYFLLAADGRVLTLYDHESQELGVREADPLTSSFRPCTQLLMVRAPGTDFVIGKEFSGELLEAGEPIELVADPEDWPETEVYCDIPWEELDKELGPRNR